MSLKRFVGVIAFGSVFSIAFYGVGCGSSGGGTGGTTGSSGTGGTTGTGGTKGAGGTMGTSGTGGSKGSGGGKGSGGTTGVGFEGGPEGGDGGGTCPASLTGFKAPTYVPAVAHQGKCTSIDLAAFLAACGDSGGATPCDNWQKANLPLGDAGAGTACGACIFAPMNNGPVLQLPNNFFSVNYDACIQLTDTTNGPTCAPLDFALTICDEAACDQCATTGSALSGCLTAVEGTGGGCASYLAAAQTPCMTDVADGGALSQCSPGASTMKQDPDWTLIINLVCGSVD
jgi:hypothetical protein